MKRQARLKVCGEEQLSWLESDSFGPRDAAAAYIEWLWNEGQIEAGESYFPVEIKEPDGSITEWDVLANWNPTFHAFRKPSEADHQEENDYDPKNDFPEIET